MLDPDFAASAGEPSRRRGPPCDRGRRRPFRRRRFNAHAIALLRSLIPQLATGKTEIGHAVVASGCAGSRWAMRSAPFLGARMVVVLIGERPGLFRRRTVSEPTWTFAPRAGLTDETRNCGFQRPSRGARLRLKPLFRIAWLIREGLARKLTGIALKDESGGRTPRGIAPQIQGQHDKSGT